MGVNDQKFTWVQTYKELVDFLVGKENDQKELIEILDRAGVQSLIDENPEGNRIRLEEIDPFSFFCFINKYGSERRRAIFQKIAKELNLHFPEDDSGLPSVQGMKVMMFPFKHQRTENEISRLWQFFYSARDSSITDEQFVDIVKINGVGLTKLTECLFYIRPETYFPIDGPTRPYMKKVLGIDPKFKTWPEYLNILKQIREKTNQPYYDLSHEAYLWNKEQNVTRYWLFQGNPSLFDVEQALKNEALSSWRVTAHNNKIKPGDKVILWASGERRGCYALAEVESDVYEDTASEDELPYYSEYTGDDTFDQVELKITHNLAVNPITYDRIANVDELKDLKIGNQGTNFSTTREEFEALLEIAESTVDDKWTRLQSTLNRIDHETGVRKFFKTAAHVINTLQMDEDHPNLYAADIDNYLQLTLGGKYVVHLQRIRSKVLIGFYVKYEYLDDLKKKYPAIEFDEEYDREDTEQIFVRINPDEANLEDFLEGSVALARESKESHSKSPYRSTYPENHNPWIIRAALEEELLEKLLNSEQPDASQIHKKKPVMNYPLNTIFYGPPSTGKTYNTIKRAAEIVEGRKIDHYNDAKLIFNDNLGDTIEFITFHQNYSYEDFIQGLRPDIEKNEELTFIRKDGIFKKLSDRALQNLKNSRKPIHELSRTKAFADALEKLKDEVIESADTVPINETAYFIGVEDDAFRYSADNWTLGGKGFNGFRMKYSDLLRFFEENVKERKDIKDLEGVSGLAKQHASYFFLTYDIIKNMMSEPQNMSPEVTKKNYVLIIDEINRANISRVFGELITLIEPDKRYGRELHISAKLPSDELFSVPENLFIIGTMNTADKSIALLDIALRRRFEFEAMYPRYKIDEEVIHDDDVLKKINERIIKLKGHDFQIGHSYFMKNHLTLQQRMNRKVIPLLLEYFMNDEKEVKDILTHAGLNIKEKSWPLEITGRA